MNRQSWSLEEGQIAASLFSKDVGNDLKARIAAKILALKPSSILDSTSLLRRGKPTLPELSSSKDLSDYVTERSVLFLERFCPKYETWLRENPPWDEISEFQTAKQIVNAIVPINDPAERLCAVAKRYKVSSPDSFFTLSQLTL